MLAVNVPQKSRLPPLAVSYKLKPTNVAAAVAVPVTAARSVAEVCGEFAAANETVLRLKYAPPEKADLEVGDEVTRSSQICAGLVGAAPCKHQSSSAFCRYSVAPIYSVHSNTNFSGQ